MSKDLSLRQKAAVQSVKWLQKIAVNKGKIGIEKLFAKHEEMLEEIQNKCIDLVTLENEKKQSQMICIICAKLIAGFDTKEKQELVCEMISTTLKEYRDIEGIE